MYLRCVTPLCSLHLKFAKKSIQFIKLQSGTCYFGTSQGLPGTCAGTEEISWAVMLCSVNRYQHRTGEKTCMNRKWVIGIAAWGTIASGLSLSVLDTFDISKKWPVLFIFPSLYCLSPAVWCSGLIFTTEILMPHFHQYFPACVLLSSVNESLRNVIVLLDIVPHNLQSAIKSFILYMLSKFCPSEYCFSLRRIPSWCKYPT